MASATPSKRTLRIDPNGNDAQEAFARADTKETYYFGGVGSGKTTGGIMRLGRHIYEWNPGETLAIIPPTVPMMRNVIIPELQQWDLYREEWHQKTENRLEYPNGTTVILESAANLQKVERLRGLNLAGAWLDEIGEHYEKTYHIIGDRLRTGNYRNLWGTGTPKGKNWVYEECVKPLVTDDAVASEAIEDGTILRGEHMTTIKGVSTRANRATPEDYKDARERQHTGYLYQQEIEGRFLEPSSGVFKSDMFQFVHPDDARTSSDWWQTVLAVDPAVQADRQTAAAQDSDYWGLAVIAANPRTERVLVTDMARRRGLTLHEGVEWIQEVTRQAPDASVVVESNQAQRFLTQALSRAGVDATPEYSTTNKEDRLMDLSVPLSNGTIEFVDWTGDPVGEGHPYDDLVAEALAFPDGDHDDLLDSLYLAVDNAPVSMGTSVLSADPYGESDE